MVIGFCQITSGYILTSCCSSLVCLVLAVSWSWRPFAYKSNSLEVLPSVLKWEGRGPNSYDCKFMLMKFPELALQFTKKINRFNHDRNEIDSERFNVAIEVRHNKLLLTFVSKISNFLVCSFRSSFRYRFCLNLVI